MHPARDNSFRFFADGRKDLVRSRLVRFISLITSFPVILHRVLRVAGKTVEFWIEAEAHSAAQASARITGPASLRWLWVPEGIQRTAETASMPFLFDGGLAEAAVAFKSAFRWTVF